MTARARRRRLPACGRTRAYEVQVRAHNDEGTSPWSAPGTGRTHENTAPVFIDTADPSAGDPEGDGVELLDLNLRVSETTTAGEPLGASVQATDVDGDVLTYSLMGRGHQCVCH